MNIIYKNITEHALCTEVDEWSTYTQVFPGNIYFNTQIP